ncbi:MAG: ORF6N domain-containing protein [Actinomycetota bacterium]|nr:ORF6N domain-containing protein [Actinomycetota bacterium]MDA8166692.1 ORF6N domain-containing protein [Actinomycetota bacterium]
MKEIAIVSEEVVEKKIVVLRGNKVMLSDDLARLYEVEHRVLIQAVKRNIERFPDDFMFQLLKAELTALKAKSFFASENLSSTATGLPGDSQRGRHAKYLPYAFTEQGVAMLSSVLRSKRAISVNIEIMRAFVSLKRISYSHADLARKLDSLEKKYDAQFRVVFEAIRQLMEPPKPKKNQIGFHWNPEAPAKKKRAPEKQAPAKRKQ